MAGRALIGNPWFFTGHKATKKERIAAAKEHIEIFDECLEEKKA
jgi:tRNA-dihydrouridine synthase